MSLTYEEVLALPELKRMRRDVHVGYSEYASAGRAYGHALNPATGVDPRPFKEHAELLSDVHMTFSDRYDARRSELLREHGCVPTPEPDSTDIGVPPDGWGKNLNEIDRLAQWKQLPPLARQGEHRTR